LAAVVLTCAAAGATAADPLKDWRLDLALGYTGAHGDVHSALGDGVAGGVGIGYLLASRVSTEASLGFGRVGDAFGGTILARQCLPPVSGTAPTCSTVPTTQHVDTETLFAGMAVALGHATGGRATEVSAGGLVGRYSLSPSAASVTRNGWGVYAGVARDLVTMGQEGAVGLTARVAHVRSHGSSFGSPLADHTSDDWVDLAVRLRFGGRRP